MVSTVLAAAGLVAISVVVVSLLQLVIDQIGVKENSPNTEKLRANKDYVTVVYENDDGYGSALKEMDGGVEVCSFNDQGEVYSSAWIAPDELEAMANELSVKAVKMGREEE
jgi:hypothetical protein